MTLEKVLSKIPDIAEYISKISGNIEATKKLSDYKRQTSVFTQNVVKKEANKFVVD